MDRLHALILLTACLTYAPGCDGEPPAPPPSASRVEAVTASGPDEDAIAGFCDVHHDGGHGPAFELPALQPDRPRPADAGPRWLNVWATWCKPCVHELPMLQQWAPRLSADAAGASVQFLNVDADADAVATFRAEHEGVPDSMRLAEPERLTDWLATLGLDPGAGLPVHVFVGGDDRIRCVRAGAVTDDHYPLVSRLLQAGD
ncbi:MAG: TlpA disulfide reductase family protein [Myxococcales bacterium]|jgi:thiol-disulfide isomerase/thioredoxin